MADIISLGECMVEFLADEPLASATTIRKSYGGDTLNLLVAASRLGASTGFITRVGQDVFAPFLLESWRQEGIDTSQVKVVPGFNGIYFISLLEGGGREFTYYRKDSAASTLAPQDIDPAYLAQARVVHLSGITQALSPSCRAATLTAAQLAHQAKVMVSYDPNLRLQLWSAEEARRAMEEVLPYLSVILPSAPDESEQLLGLSAPEAVVEYFWKRGVNLVVVKRAEAGCLVGAEGKMTSLPASALRGVVDTTGAGDAFNGAFLYGLVQGHEPLTAARLGVAVSGFEVGGRGAVAGLPPRQEAQRLLAALLNG